MANNNYDIDIVDIIKRSVTNYKLYRATSFFVFEFNLQIMKLLSSYIRIASTFDKCLPQVKE